jgi:excisionase family DNA binding protein
MSRSCSDPDSLRNPCPPLPAQPNQERLLLRPAEAAEALGVSQRTLMSWVAAGQIPATRIGERCLRFSVDSLREWIVERTQKTNPI